MNKGGLSIFKMIIFAVENVWDSVHLSFSVENFKSAPTFNVAFALSEEIT